jgi:hypothetical protein
MKNILIMAALLGASQGAASGIRNEGASPWPKYATVSQATNYYWYNLHNSGYSCIRNNYYWAFPQ